MVKLRIGVVAREDLRDIRIYSKAQFGPAVARDYLLGLNALFAVLRERPGAGALEHDLGPDIRGFAYRSHRVYYRFADDAVTIVRILHHARDAGRWIGDQA